MVSGKFNKKIPNSLLLSWGWCLSIFFDGFWSVGFESGGGTILRSKKKYDVVELSLS